MKTHLGLIASLVVLIATPLWAHHPAEDILDDEIYAMIDDNVADTPHATLTFDDMGNTIITTESVSDAEDLLSSSLLAAFSLLGDLDQQVETAADALLYFSEQTADSNLPEEPLTLTITYGPYIEPDDQDVLDTEEENRRWTERDDWGRSVRISINRELPLDPIVPEDPMD
jgi:hypothetical protein